MMRLIRVKVLWLCLGVIVGVWRLRMWVVAGWWALYLVGRTRIWVVHVRMVVIPLHWLRLIDVGVVAWVAWGRHHYLRRPDGVIVGFFNGVVVLLPDRVVLGRPNALVLGRPHNVIWERPNAEFVWLSHTLLMSLSINIAMKPYGLLSVFMACWRSRVLLRGYWLWIWVVEWFIYFNCLILSMFFDFWGNLLKIIGCVIINKSGWFNGILNLLHWVSPILAL
jgi:hypothetical protein